LSTSWWPLYSFETSPIVFLINSMYSFSVRKWVFSFQKPGPQGLVVALILTVIIQWSVRYPGRISGFKNVWTERITYQKIIQATLNFRVCPFPCKAHNVRIMDSPDISNCCIDTAELIPYSSWDTAWEWYKLDWICVFPLGVSVKPWGCSKTIIFTDFTSI